MAFGARTFASLLSRDPRVLVEVCLTCEERAERRAVSRARPLVVEALASRGLSRRCQVVSAGCLLRCPSHGVTVRVDHDPCDYTRGTTLVVDDGEPRRLDSVADVCATVVGLRDEGTRT